MLHKVNVVGVTGINISASSHSNAISDIGLEDYLVSNGVKLDMDNMWLGDEIRLGSSLRDWDIETGDRVKNPKLLQTSSHK